MRASAAAPLFAALGDETRLRLVTRLCEEGPLSIARITAGGSVTRQAITKHLHVLEGAGLVRGSREGRERVWELEPRRLAAARGYLELVSRRWDGALARLRAFVEGETSGAFPPAPPPVTPRSWKHKAAAPPSDDSLRGGSRGGTPRGSKRKPAPPTR